MEVESNLIGLILGFHGYPTSGSVSHPRSVNRHDFWKTGNVTSSDLWTPLKRLVLRALTFGRVGRCGLPVNIFVTEIWIHWIGVRISGSMWVVLK